MWVQRGPKKNGRSFTTKEENFRMKTNPKGT
jgi:hypothetical protein